MMKKLTVYYCGWGEDWPLGTLADDGRSLLFEYSREALAQGLELSPLHLKLAATTYGGFPRFQMRLPGLMADSLPDGWAVADGRPVSPAGGATSRPIGPPGLYR